MRQQERKFGKLHTAKCLRTNGAQALAARRYSTESGYTCSPAKVSFGVSTSKTEKSSGGSVSKRTLAFRSWEAKPTKGLRAGAATTAAVSSTASIFFCLWAPTARVLSVSTNGREK